MGHQAAALSLASIRPRRGLLAFFSVSTVLPDLFMLGASPLHSTLNFHADWGLMVCGALVVLAGVFLGVGRAAVGLALVALASHLPLDILYMSRDASNLYSKPWTDFTLEASLLVLAAWAYAARAHLEYGRRLVFAGIIAGLLASQAAWDFGGGFFRF